jgi:hypothetical protein
VCVCVCVWGGGGLEVMIVIVKRMAEDARMYTRVDVGLCSQQDQANENTNIVSSIRTRKSDEGAIDHTCYSSEWNTIITTTTHVQSDRSVHTC